MPLFRRSSGPSPTIVADRAQDDTELAAVRDALVATGDWRPAAELLTSTRDDPDRRTLVAEVLSDTAGTAPAPWLGEWLAQRPDDPGVHLLLAWGTVVRAWEARGGGWAEDTGRDRFAVFFRLLEDAVPRCHEAARRGGDDPTPWVVFLWLAIGRQEPREVFDDRWRELVARHPHNRVGHIAALQYRAEKWHGSHEDMYAFVHERSEVPFAPVLPLQAHVELVLREEHKGGAEAAAVQGFWRRPEVQPQLDAALQWARQRPRHGFALHDLTVVGYGLSMAERWADAAELFALTGHRAYEYPWYYAGDPQTAFAEAHKRALKGKR